jgi:hypothetical protein
VAFTSSIPLTSEDLDLFQRIVTNLKDLVNDPIIFKMVILLILTRPNDSEPESGVLSRFHSQMQIILQRRLVWEPKLGISYNEIMNLLSDLPRLSDILNKIIKD